MQAQDTDIWLDRAVRLIGQASEELADNPDDGIIGTVSAALAALRVAWGDEPSPDLLDYFRGEEADPMADCTCPPELIARGGWQSTCPAHGRHL